MIVLNCATGSIDPYSPSPDMPWNKQRVQHLFRRLGYGASHAEMEAALLQDPQTLIDQMLDDAIAAPLTTAPVWANWTILDYDDFNEQLGEQYAEWLTTWTKDMLLGNSLRERITLFWHNHLVTLIDSYACPPYMYQYHKILQENALGNFRDLVYEMGTSSAMLVFLNGNLNSSASPNENYARELYELFTLGRDNGYDQNDIAETARALTGFVGRSVDCGPFFFVDVLHDTGEKTIFGQTGNWGYDDVHELLFTQRADQIATYICTKIYQVFVNPDVDENIVEALATTFKTNNFELAPVFRQLFKSEHFFDEAHFSTVIKNPIELLLTFYKEAQIPFDDDQRALELAYYALFLGQQLFNPPDVSGWPGDQAWIDTSSLPNRWQANLIFLLIQFENRPEQLVDLAKVLSNNSNDPAYVSQVFIEYFIPSGLQTPEDYDRATTVFKWEVPQNYYDDELWNLDWDTAPTQITLLIYHLIRIPEFQLS
ncbi:MAG: DUF1800 domain-containing protein [Bacteroidota bacterium]